MYLATNVIVEKNIQQIKGILDLFARILPNNSSAIYLVNNGKYELIAYHGSFSFADALQKMEFSQRLLQRRLRITKLSTSEDKLWKWLSVNGAFQEMVTEPIRLEDEPVGFICIGLEKSQNGGLNYAEALSTGVNLIETAINNAARYEEAINQNEFLLTLHEISIVKNLNDNLISKLAKCACEIGNYYNADATGIYLASHFGKQFHYAAGWGKCLDDLKKHTADFKYDLEKSVASQREIKHITIQKSQGNSYGAFSSLLEAPLIVSDNVYGIMKVGFEKSIPITFAQGEQLQAFADQIARLIQTDIYLHGMQLSSEVLMQAYDAILEAWSYALELRDFETRGHSHRVVELVCKLGEKLGVRGEDLDNLRRGALLHDIGKLGIPDQILLKPSSLTEDEWKVMHKHPIYAKEMLSRIPFLMPLLDIPCYHHEKWDGSGYPYGLAGEEIPYSARIFSIVDVWDALNSDRPYRQAWEKPEVIRYIKNETGKHFDPAIVRAFLPLV